MSNLGNKKTMAENLSYYIELSGKTQKELSEIVGVAYSTFNDWVNGKKYPRIDKIEIMANYFGILKSDLIEEKRMKEHPEEMAALAASIMRDPDLLDMIEKTIRKKPFEHQFCKEAKEGQEESKKMSGRSV